MQDLQSSDPLSFSNVSALPTGPAAAIIPIFADIWPSALAARVGT